MLIIVGREDEGLYKGLKPRQEANGKDRVILDRRIGDRRHGARFRPTVERRRQDRRRPISDAECALMKILGFTVLPRELRVISGKRELRKSLARRAPTRVAQLCVRRAARPAAAIRWDTMTSPSAACVFFTTLTVRGSTEARGGN
jgi:hypothetical protein